MKHLDDHRDPLLERRRLLARLRSSTTRAWTIMDVCGGHTRSRGRLTELLPRDITLLPGPGCPGCALPPETIDKAVAIAARKDVILTGAPELLRLPGGRGDLLGARARGGDVRAVRRPLDAVRIAEGNPDREVVFLAAGFETTAPANARAVLHAKARGLGNFRVLVGHSLVPPAITATLEAPDDRVQAFLAAGQVCAVMGWTEYEPIAARYRVPIVVTGPGPLDLLEGIAAATDQLESGQARVENRYAARESGALAGRDLVGRVFRVTGLSWRGTARRAPGSLRLSEEFAEYDAELRFGELHTTGHSGCIASDILRGTKPPIDCASYGTRCTPRTPLGAPMVSTRGACAAFYTATPRRRSGR
ncbi:hydrogenase formation protein HypD [Sciscionella sediminilitoris]|uniref:hydrogenase formation protein HypD n=1 Tax=Sciscionella sediminilitoris TaxID=1445613 RepID=UPI0004DF7554|nr:hydrogenase formation protein HypD [Sciscionella sp. SE31]